MENLTKENDNFKSTMLEDVKKMVDGHSETRQFAGSQVTIFCQFDFEETFFKPLEVKLIFFVYIIGAG